MLEYIKVMVMKRLFNNTFATKKYVGQLGLRVRMKLHENKLNSWKCIVLFNGDNEYEVNEGKKGFGVRLSDRTYTCREWDLFGIPCLHVMCNIYDEDKDPEEFVANWYYKEKYL